METQDAAAAAAELESVSQRVNMEEMTEGFRRLYTAAGGVIFPELAAQYFNEGHRAFNAGSYSAAAAALEQAVVYDAANEEALYELAQSYRILGENDKALEAYNKVIQLFPDSWRAENSKSYIDRLNGN